MSEELEELLMDDERDNDEFEKRLRKLREGSRERNIVARSKPGAYRKFRNGSLRSKYGLTLYQWESMFVAQGSCCAICKSPEHKGRGWCTDHCHKNGQVRGILCLSCNIMIGHAKDNLDTLVSAIGYLANRV